MVCEKCEKKLGKICTPEPWKTGSSAAGPAGTSGGRKLNENKALSQRKNKFNPYTTTFNACRICKTKVHQVGSHYCQGCAYKKGICAMCGKKILDTKNYRQSSV
ncbi:cysteine-rich PDZ-binding protein-like [Tropilaelaps mercedesae]|uniref:Cysteine-rich PDZ-binding protein n=1 Tax=Tropilaelaps mercedesae TaxID=418985 RepID=A0A1V9XEC2_9ACAR|nr:cysteine-rich PDZ-binding protein-like [Tropilaelaps mercedesae]